MAGGSFPVWDELFVNFYGADDMGHVEECDEFFDGDVVWEFLWFSVDGAVHELFPLPGSRSVSAVRTDWMRIWFRLPWKCAREHLTS